MNTRDVVNKLIGAKTYENTQVLNSTVDTSITPIVSTDPGAVSIVIVNLGTNDVTIWVDETVSLTKGIILAADGGNVVWDVTRHFMLPTKPWFGIANGGSSEIAVIRQSIQEPPATPTGATA